MEKNRSKVLMSILIIALCLAVCVGLTYAYFTDSAKSSGNKIQAGNLKLDLQLYDKTDGWHSIKDSQDPVFNYDKWEPGYVDVKLLRIVNLGDLAMQWEAKIVSTETISELANVIEVYVQTSNSEMPYPANRAEALAWTKVGTLDQFINTTEKLASGTFTAQGEAYYISIALYMPAEITDNTLQEKVVGEFDIQINATQLAYESDAFGPDYDTSATLPEGGASTPSPDSIFTFSLNGDNASYTITGLVEPETVENIEIPATYKGLPVTAIGDYAFEWDYTITSVTIPDSVTIIGKGVFDDCGRLEKVNIPDSIITIDEGAFAGCQGLTELTFGNGVTTIGNSAFQGCSGLTGELVIPDHVTTIGDYAFENCPRLTSVQISNGITTLGDYVFAECYGLTGDLIIPNNVTAIGNSAFFNCYGLTGKLVIPEGVTTISDRAFSNCAGLTGELIIPEGVTTLGDSAFEYCSKLTGELIIPEGVITIGNFAFKSCIGLTEELTIPDSVTAIGDSAFSWCQNLTKITFEGTMAQWNAISLGSGWNFEVPATEVVCTDGTVALN